HLGRQRRLHLQREPERTGRVSNLFDKRLYRQGNSFDAGAATYNEPGRAYYVSMTTSF
ncbi:hypothetical protein AM469_000960, partial [Pseudomonas aeruginosa]